MTLNAKYIHAASRTLSIPIEELTDMWAHGTDVSILPMVDLVSPLSLEQKTFFLFDGIIREYFVGDDGSEYTLRIIQGPAFITPSMNNMLRENEPLLISQSLTPLVGRFWDIQFMFSLTFQNPVFFRSGLKTIIDSIRIKVQNDIRRHDCTAKEKYELFIKEYPGAVNLIPLKYIASYLSITPETVSRIRKNISTR